APVGLQGDPLIVRGSGGQRTVRVAVHLQEVGRDGGGENHAVQASFAVAGNITGHLDAAHGEADERDVAEIEIADDPRQVIAQRVVVVGATGLGTPEAAAVIGDHAVAGSPQRLELVLPRLTREGPAVHQHHGTARATEVDDVQGNVGSVH